MKINIKQISQFLYDNYEIGTHPNDIVNILGGEVDVLEFLKFDVKKIFDVELSSDIKKMQIYVKDLITDTI